VRLRPVQVSENDIIHGERWTFGRQLSVVRQPQSDELVVSGSDVGWWFLTSLGRPVAQVMFLADQSHITLLAGLVAAEFRCSGGRHVQCEVREFPYGTEIACSSDRTPEHPEVSVSCFGVMS
jgi:hypothetical protein